MSSKMLTLIKIKLVNLQNYVTHFFFYIQFDKPIKTKINKFRTPQESFTTWTNFKRGNTARIVTKKRNKRVLKLNLKPNSRLKRPRIQKNLLYSLKNKSVNLNLLNSILYLETNSDSLSSRSQGVRPNSIRQKLRKRKIPMTGTELEV